MGQNCIKYPSKISEKLWAAESEGTQESRVSNNPQCARLGYHRDFSEKNLKFIAQCATNVFLPYFHDLKSWKNVFWSLKARKTVGTSFSQLFLQYWTIYTQSLYVNSWDSVLNISGWIANNST